jgi:hypothetical protein
LIYSWFISPICDFAAINPNIKIRKKITWKAGDCQPQSHLDRSSRKAFSNFKICYNFCLSDTSILKFSKILDEYHINYYTGVRETQFILKQCKSKIMTST